MAVRPAELLDLIQGPQVLALIRSKRDALALQRQVGIDGRASARPDLEMQMGAGYIARGTYRSYFLPGKNRLAAGDLESVEVAVPDLGSVLESDDHAVAVGG